VSDDSILFSRLLPQGPLVRVRRTTPAGTLPVAAVLEVERRAGSARGGYPPLLMSAEGASEAAVLDTLRAHAMNDRSLAELMREKGLQ
jgi:hypothetical protein